MTVSLSMSAGNLKFVVLSIVFGVFTASYAPCSLAAPGDTAYFEGLELNPFPWTRSNTNRAGFSGNSNQTRNSGNRSLYTRGGPVTVTSPTLDLSNLPGAAVTAWVRRGSDSFSGSEDPDSGEDLVFEYLNSGGTWVEIDSFTGSGTQGQIFNVDSGNLPPNALHNNFQLRLRQLDGNTQGGLFPTYYDYWHVDDIRVVQRGATSPVTTLAVGACDDFENGFDINWNLTATTGDGDAGTSLITSQSSLSSMYTAAGDVTVTSNIIDTSPAAFSTLSLWLREGQDNMSNTNANSSVTAPDGNKNISEDLDPGESLVLEYFDSSNNWVELETFVNVTNGRIITRDYNLPTEGRHSNFRLRFRQLIGGSSGTRTGLDFWHVDDVCLNVSPDPIVTVKKYISTVVSDPVNGVNNPKAIPDAIVEYAIQVTNTGPGPTSSNTLVLSDPIPSGTRFIVSDIGAAGSGPVRFENGAPPSGLSYTFNSLGSTTDDLTFYDINDAPFTPTADGDNSDSDVARIEITPKNSLQPTSPQGDPSFTVYFRVIIQ